MRQYRINPAARSRDGAVDPLLCQQQRTADLLRKAQVQQRGFDRRRVGESGEVI